MANYIGLLSDVYFMAWGGDPDQLRGAAAGHLRIANQEGTIAIQPKKGQYQGQYNWYIYIAQISKKSQKVRESMNSTFL